MKPKLFGLLRRLGKSLVKLLIAGIVITAVVGPVSYGAFGLDGLVAGLGWGLVGGLVVGLGWGLVEGLVAGLVGGLVAAFGGGLGGDWALVAGLVGGLAIGLMWGLKWGLLSLVVGVPGGLVLGLSGGLVLGLGGGLGIVFGTTMGLLLRPGLMVLPDLRPYLQALLLPLIGFAVVFFLILLLFAGWFATAHRLDPMGAFAGVPEGAGFWDFFYFSVMTNARLGYSQILPASPLTQFLVWLETIVGTALVVAGFAAIVAYLQPRFGEIVRKQSEKNAGSTKSAPP